VEHRHHDWVMGSHVDLLAARCDLKGVVLGIKSYALKSCCMPINFSGKVDEVCNNHA